MHLMKEKTAKWILSFVMIIYLVYTFTFSSIIPDTLLYLTIIVCFVNQIALRRRYLKAMKGEMIFARLSGSIKTNRLESIKILIGLLIIILMVVWAVFFFDLSFQRKQHLALFLFNGLMVFINFSDMNILYKFCPRYMIIPGSQIEKISWTFINNFKINDKRTKIYITENSNKIHVINLRKLLDGEKDEIEKYLHTRINT